MSHLKAQMDRTDLVAFEIDLNVYQTSNHSVAVHQRTTLEVIVVLACVGSPLASI